jgi:hypothetical protein
MGAEKGCGGDDMQYAGHQDISSSFSASSLDCSILRLGASERQRTNVDALHARRTQFWYASITSG